MLMKKEDKNVRSWTSEQRDELLSSVVKNMPKSKELVPFDLAQKYVIKPITFQRKIREMFFFNENGLIKKVEGRYPESLLEFHEGWPEFYKNFGINIDLNDFPLPQNLILEDGQDYWSIITPNGFNPQKAFALRKEISPVYENTKVSKIVDFFPVKVSVIKANQNAMAEYPNISLNKSLEIGLFGTTFTEGTLIDARMCKEKGIHLDEKGWTLHNGSRGEDGGAVFSCWSDDIFWVGWSDGGDSDDNLSLRQKQF